MKSTEMNPRISNLIDELLDELIAASEKDESEMHEIATITMNRDGNIDIELIANPEDLGISCAEFSAGITLGFAKATIASILAATNENKDASLAIIRAIVKMWQGYLEDTYESEEEE